MTENAQVNRWKTLGKGEIACYKQFLLFPQCFQKTVLQTHKNQDLFGKGLTLYQTTNVQMCSSRKH